MPFTLLNVKVLAFLAALTTPIYGQRGAYFTMGSDSLVTESLDPLLSPGTKSSHVHSVFGGSGFSASADFAALSASKCTSLDVIDDKSAYWTPTLYFNKGGQFTRVPETFVKHKLYYKYGKGDNTPDLEQTEFPEGFRMMAGNANLRSDDGSMGSGGSQLNWQCHRSGGPKTTGFPKGFTDCNGYISGLAATMRFPSCWNGQDFNKDAPLAHMSYPTNRDGMAGCPEGFKKARFPEIMIEYWLDTKPFDNQYGANEIPWVLSNGDPTGYGFHMDFLNGWKKGVLAKAMKTCDAGNTGAIDTPQCFGGSVQKGPTKDACKIAPTVQEDVGMDGPLKQLPGCNPVQPGPGLATKPANCAAGGAVTKPTSVPGGSVSSQVSATPTSLVDVEPVQTTAEVSTPVSTEEPEPETSSDPVVLAPSDGDSPAPVGSPSGQSPPSVNSTSGVWKAAGCFLDAMNPRSLGKRPEWWGRQITSTGCVEHCDSIGAKYAGTENGGQCFCGDELVNSAKHADKCDMKCAGDDSEICGGRGHLSIYSVDGTVAMKKRMTHHRHNRHLKAAF
ncbi:MAG: hypothetical protein Q9174_001361 [Haloplaca sp. 1 TL-2023]